MSRHLIMIEYLEDQWFLTGVKMRMDPQGNQLLIPIEVAIPKIASLGPLYVCQEPLIMIEYLEDQ